MKNPDPARMSVRESHYNTAVRWFERESDLPFLEALKEEPRETFHKFVLNVRDIRHRQLDYVAPTPRDINSRNDAGSDTLIIAPSLGSDERDVVIEIAKNPSLMDILLRRNPAHEIIDEINFTVPGIES